jgi:hypothetical protein
MDDFSEQDEFDLDPEPEEDEVDPYGELLGGNADERWGDRAEFCQICGREMSVPEDVPFGTAVCEDCRGIPAPY